MKRLVFIGNGFDRQIGLNSDYNSFIEWCREKNYIRFDYNINNN